MRVMNYEHVCFVEPVYACNIKLQPGQDGRGVVIFILLSAVKSVYI